MDQNVKHVAENECSKVVGKIQYQSMVGSMFFAAMASRLDISQAVEALSIFNSTLTEAHLTIVKQIVRYLKGTINTSIQYKK